MAGAETGYAGRYGRVRRWRKVMCIFGLVECPACRWWRESGRP